MAMKEPNMSGMFDLMNQNQKMIDEQKKQTAKDAEALQTAITISNAKIRKYQSANQFGNTVVEQKPKGILD